AATNTTPVGAYRGAGRPEACALLERIIDMAAAELAIDPVELRRRNLPAADAFPVATATGFTYDSGDYHRARDTVVDVLGYDGQPHGSGAASAADGDARPPPRPPPAGPGPGRGGPPPGGRARRHRGDRGWPPRRPRHAQPRRHMDRGGSGSR